MTLQPLIDMQQYASVIDYTRMLVRVRGAGGVGALESVGKQSKIVHTCTNCYRKTHKNKSVTNRHTTPNDWKYLSL